MPAEKQARFSVSIPYELRDNQLRIQPIAWPGQCPCCQEKDGAALEKFKYKHSARYSQTTTGNTTTTSSFPLVWEIPYCSTCIQHMKITENWKYGIIAACILTPIILTMLIDASSGMLILLLYVVFILAGLGLYRVIVATVVKSRQKPGCLDRGLAFWASSPATNEHKIIFQFRTEGYARVFAELNQAELKDNSSGEKS